MSMISFKGRAGLLLAMMGAVCVTPAAAQDHPVTVEAVYTADLIGPIAGGVARRGVALDNLDLIADIDLDQVVGWRGATAHGYLLVNQGGIPNDFAGSLQGVDNIEVGRQGVRLYELWIDAPLGERGSVLAGLYDLNSEFYVTEASGLLLAPPFGIGSELAATGSAGPSIFPSTALAVRFNYRLDAGYIRAAAFNARAGAPGDPGGVDTGFDDGALLIAEAGGEGDSGRIAVGVWRYSRTQDDIRDLGPGGAPRQRTAQGAYLLAEKAIAGDNLSRKSTGFIRLGLSDGRTSTFGGGWQAGVLVERVIDGRPDSALSVGVQQGVLSSRMRDVMALGGVDAARAETGIEFTYFDQLTDRISIQPDLQLVFQPGGDRSADLLVVAGVRLSIILQP